MFRRRPQFTSKVSRVEENTCDDLKKTKMSLKEGQRGRFGFAGFFGSAASDHSDDENDGPLVKKRVTIGGAIDDATSSDDEPQVDECATRAGPRRSSRRLGAYASTGAAIDLRGSRSQLMPLSPWR